MSFLKKLGSFISSPVGGVLGSGLSALAGGYLDSKDSRRANQWSAQQAQINRDFQERMSNTAHQREVADLRAAGLNPILSAQKGASSPGGVMAQTFKAQRAHSAASVANLNAQTRQILAQARGQEIANTRTETTEPFWDRVGDLTQQGGRIWDRILEWAEENSSQNNSRPPANKPPKEWEIDPIIITPSSPGYDTDHKRSKRGKRK